MNLLVPRIGRVAGCACGSDKNGVTKERSKEEESGKVANESRERDVRAGSVGGRAATRHLTNVLPVVP